MASSRGFRVDTVEPSWYPGPRKKRAGVPTEPPAEGYSAPRTRLFPWLINEQANKRMTWSFPRCVGPAIFKDLFWGTSAHTSPLNVTLEVGYATVPVTENGVSLALARPYTVLTEFQDPFNQIADAAGLGYPDATTPTTFTRFLQPLDLILTQAEFYPVLSLWNNTASAQEFHGTLRVIENLDREAIRFFL